MNIKVKDVISFVLPLTTILIAVVVLRVQPTGLAGYVGEELYRLNGSLVISLEEKIPADSYVNIKIDGYEIDMNIIDFLERSGKPYKVYNGEIIANDRYIVDFDSLGIVQGFEQGKHKIKIEIVYDGRVLHIQEEVIEI